MDKERTSRPRIKVLLILKQKSPILPKQRIEDCTRLLGPQVAGGAVRATRCRPLTGRSSGSWIALLPAPSRSLAPVALAGFVPNHSGGTATVSHRLPFSPPRGPVSIFMLPGWPGGVKLNRRRPAEGEGPPGQPQGGGHRGALGLEQEIEPGVRPVAQGLEMPHALGQDEVGPFV
jgi:hypothetical protein